MAHYSYFAENKKPCPFSRARLQELYLSNSMAEIARIAGPEWGSIPAGETVKSWLLEAGVTLRTRSECLKLKERKGENRQIHTPESREKRKRTIAPVLVGRRIVVKFGRNFTDADRKRAGDATRKRLAEGHVTKQCATCTSLITRPAYRMRADHVFCNKTCSNRWTHTQRQKSIHTPEAHRKQSESLTRSNAEKRERRRAEFATLGLLDLEQVAERAGVSVHVANKAVQFQMIIAWQDKPVKLYREEDIDRWIESRQKPRQ